MNYIPHQLKTDPQITSLKSDYLVIVHPFAKVKRSKSNVYPSTVKLSPLSGVPKIFKSKVPVEIHERCYRDNYMVTAGEKSVFVRRRRSPIDVDAEGFVEVEINKSISEECFPVLRRYDIDKRYRCYSHKINNNTHFVLIEIDGKYYFRVEIKSMTSLSDANIDKLNKFIKDNIRRYITSDK